ncbi:MAG TPA: thioesterase domain-containing protein, partial [Solirubrobacteraceae bacterium]|nr:thioesterase domain-containing protein [Solirubrobacteraceae bacterium]
SALLRGIVRVPRRRSRSVPVGLGQRLAAAPEDQRERVALEFVLGEIAVVLGHDSAETIDPARAFLELGFDSLTAVELRNRLNAAMGTSLPNSIVFDHPTPAALASYLALSVSGAAGPELSPGELISTDPSSTGAQRGMLTSLFREAHELERIGEFTRVLMAASRFRATFDLATGSEGALEPIGLSEGEARPDLVCFPSAVAMSGAHEYARFASAFRGARKVTVLPSPGYVSGESLPASLDVMVQAQAEALCRHAKGAPFALVGYSSGGILAHALASHLERTGVTPAAVVLIDTYLFDDQTLSELTGAALKGDEAFKFINDTRLTAMGAYLEMFAGWKPAEIAAPVLLARALDPVPGTAQGDRRSSWELSHTAIDVPGHHFTIMDGLADTTAKAVEEWLSTMSSEHEVIQAC